MKYSEELYRDVEAIWEDYHKHPFVKGIGDGSLPVEKFQYYMIQDYLYLLEYAKIFALGLVKASDPKDMQYFARDLDVILNREMEIHRAYLKRLGIPEEKVMGAKAALANISYTNYMLAKAYEGGIEEILASLLSCSWSYAEIGGRLASEESKKHPFFGEWIRGYSSQEYEETNRHLIAWMDRLAEGMSEEKRKKCKDIFRNCSLYERDFWDMAWEMG